MEGRKTTVRVGRATQKPERVLADEAYWNVTFLERYLDRCDEVAVHEPKKAYEMTEPVIQLADARIHVGKREGTYKSAKERRSYCVQARIVRAQAARCVGKYEVAEELFQAAFGLAKKPIDSSVKARLHTRYAWLLFAKNDVTAIIKHAEEAIELDSDKITLGAALILRGAAAFKFEERSGLDYLAKAVALTRAERTSKRGRRVFNAALHGLAKILSESHPFPATLRKAYLLLGEVKSYLAGRPKSVAKMQVYWLMGRIAWQLGYDRHGPRLLLRARGGFRDLGEPVEFAMVSLDAAGLALEAGEFAEYDALLADTHAFLKSFDDPKLLKALSSWSRDVRVSRDVLRETRQAIEALRDGE